VAIAALTLQPAPIRAGRADSIEDGEISSRPLEDERRAAKGWNVGVRSVARGVASTTLADVSERRRRRYGQESDKRRAGHFDVPQDW